MRNYVKKDKKGSVKWFSDLHEILSAPVYPG